MTDAFYVPYLKATWRMLGYRFGPAGRVALYGAGTHTRWLLDVIRGTPGPGIVAVLDDDPTTDRIEGIPVVAASDFDPTTVEAVVLSSD
ncbi:MAG: hypothetical protein D6788_08485, partial [Planctomycetota bacterium]